MAGSSTYFDPSSYVQQQASQQANAGGLGQLSGYDAQRSGQAAAPSPYGQSGLGDSGQSGQYSGLDMAINQSLNPGASPMGLLGGRVAPISQSSPDAQQAQLALGSAGAPGASSAGPRGVISQVAAQEGVPANLAIAMAQAESGLNPNSVGDNGSSYGLYQLHQGGELGSMSPQSVMGAGGEALNARTALGELAGVLRGHPGIDPGMAAAMAQRPANQAAYAAAIDALIRQGY